MYINVNKVSKLRIIQVYTYLFNWCIFAICETIKRELTLTGGTRVYWTNKPKVTLCPISIKRLAFQQGSKLRLLACFTFTQKCLFCVYFKWWFKKAETTVNTFSWYLWIRESLCYLFSGLHFSKRLLWINMFIIFVKVLF